jgi:hypothetical protein
MLKNTHYTFNRHNLAPVNFISLEIIKRLKQLIDIFSTTDID